MHQVLFHLPSFLPLIGGMPIYGYGVMLVIGFFAAMELAKFLARRSGIDPELFANAALIALVAGVVGARLSHVIENIGDYTRSDLSFTQNLWNAINIRSGGLTYYGGFLLAFAAVLAYGISKKVPLRLGMDIIAPCVLVGLGFGRIGCYLNGCCYGAQTNVPWAVEFPYRTDAYLEQWEQHKIQVPPELLERTPDGRLMPTPIDQLPAGSAERALAMRQHSLAVHPAQWYSTITAWLIAAFLVAYFALPHAPGRVFALMLILEGISRFLLEEVRAEPVFDPFGKHIFGTMSYSMVLSVPLVLLGLVLWFWFGSRPDWKSQSRHRAQVIEPVPA